MDKTHYQHEQLTEIGADVYEHAQYIFEQCNAGDDFCHQTGLVFGGWNRIKLTARGWIEEESHCSEAFLQAFEKLVYTRLST